MRYSFPVAAGRTALLRDLGPDEWKRDADCRDLDPAIFFPVGLADEHTPYAKEVCAGCPVMQECLAYALQVSDTDGIWAGTDRKEREKIRRARRRRVHL